MRLAVGLLLLATIPCFGQDKSAFPFVDMGKAQALIDVLTKENETLKADADRLRREAAELSAQVTDSQKGAAELVPLWNAVKARYGELATIEAEAVDRDLKARSAAASATTRDLLKRLSARIDELGLKAAGLGHEVETRLAQVAVDEARLTRNTDDIIILQATLARTKAQQGRLETVLGELTTLSAQAEAALK
jgi:cell division septum initiation protein DivIVA